MVFYLTILLIAVTVIISIKGFSDAMFRAKAMFYPYDIKERNEWYRFLTSGFLHADWLHLIVNMYVLYLFGRQLEDAYIQLLDSWGRLVYLLMYLTAIPIANISTYIKHKDYSGYAALGASGAVSAVVFANILIWPDMSLMLLFLPIPMPAIVLGLLYLLYSYIMSRRGGDNINHEAHFYGAIYGFLFTLVLEPRLFNLFIQKIQNLI